MYGECWRTGKEEWAHICCAALTAWDGGSRWGISLSRLDGCGNEKTRKLKATKPRNQFLSSTPAIHLVLQSCLVFPNTLASGFWPLCPMPIPIQPMDSALSGTHFLHWESKTKEKKQIISPFLPCLPSGKITTIQIEQALETWGCSTSPERSSRDCDMRRRGNDAENDALLLTAPLSATAGGVQTSSETQGWKLLLKQQYQLLWERMRKATGCHATPGKNGLNKNSKLRATSWPNITLLSTQLTLGNGALSSLPCYSRIYDRKEKQ